MKTIQKIFLCVLFIFSLLVCTQPNVNAASAKISVSNPNPKPGEKVTVTGTATAGAWNLTLSGNGKSETIYGYTNSNGNSTGTKSITFTAGNAGEKYTFSLNGGMTDINSDKEESVSKTASIVVAKNTATTNTTTSSNASNQKTNTASTATTSNSSSDSTTAKEPKFTDVNKTATITAKVNFRSSYSATSSALGKIKEGETVTLIAKGDNGWSKIKYNDKTGYIKTEFLSLTNEGTETEEENQEETEEIFGLDSLKIKDYELTPKFSTDVYEYTIETTDEIKELEITQAVANVQTAKVEIKGNENFKLGENIVTINITDDASDDTAVYTIKVKISEKEEIVEEEPDQTIFNEEVDRIQKDLNLRNWLIRGIIIFVTVIIIIMFILRYRTLKQEEEDDEYNIRDGYVIIDEKFDSQEVDKQKIAKIEQFDEELEKNKDKDIEPPVQPRRMKKSKGKHF